MNPSNNTPYMIAVAIMIVIGVVAITLVEIFHTGDNSTTIAAIIGILTPTTLSLLAFMKAQETHLSVNSRLDGFIKNADMAARNEGIAQGIAEGTVAANARTDALDKDINTQKTVVNTNETLVINKNEKGVNND